MNVEDYRCSSHEVRPARRFPFRTSVVELLVTPHILGLARRSEAVS
jgi:hypothetical protein